MNSRLRRTLISGIRCHRPTQTTHTAKNVCLFSSNMPTLQLLIELAMQSSAICSLLPYHCT